MIEIVKETPALHAAAIEALFDRTFGPGHFAKTAERLRESAASIPDVNRVAILDDQVVGVCRVWPLKVGKNGDRALFYGPVAVAPDRRGDRLGLRLTEAALEAGRDAGWPAAILIGSPAYFGEIGFSVTPHGRLTFPGPQDQTRVMVKDLAGDAGELEGLVTAL
jgi:predicted N-acetyltransferase YhbS